jgi:probable H4MPT-linked C1 transfer pathway protein
MILGLDIGGANLKAATSTGLVRSQPFDLWRTPDALGQRLTELIAGWPLASAWGVTMTGELADCFSTKQEGVERILAQIESAAAGIPVRVWNTEGAFVTPSAARAAPLSVAASNWHALATWAGRLAPHPSAILIDIGSTTTDLIPLRDGVPCAQGRTDVTRLLAGEMVYTGVSRTPLCAVDGMLPYRGRMCPVAAEWFATMRDVYLWLGDLPEDPQDRQTANGQPATREAAHDRLARMACCDRTEFTASDADAAARWFAQQQEGQIAVALSQVTRANGPYDAVLISGAGSFLGRRIASAHTATRDAALISLDEQWSREIAEAACAYAVACLGMSAA